MTNRKIRIFFLAVSLLFIGIVATDASYKSERVKKMSEQWLIIENVNIITMTEDAVLKNKTVVIQNDQIVDIKDQSPSAPPENAIIISGADKYLMPGLVDMHVHITSKKDLDLFVANGVTTVQNMWGYEGFINVMGFPNQLQYKKRIDENLGSVGPTIYTAGPVLEGRPKSHPFMMEITNGKSARRLIKEQVQKGYDFIKVYDHLSEEVYQSIIEECRELRLPVKGHVPFKVGLLKAIQSGQKQIDHLTGYLDYDSVKLLVSPKDLLEYGELACKYEVFHCPTVVFTQKRITMDKFEEMAKHPAMKYLNFMQRFFLRQAVRSLEKDLRYQGEDYQRDVFELYRMVIQSLRDCNAPVLTGTDSGNPFVFPGFALHEELELLVKTGMSPFEALRCASVNPFISLNKIQEIGTVEIGKRADLILLRRNPLENITATQEIESVIVKGKFLDRGKLDKLLD